MPSVIGYKRNAGQKDFYDNNNSFQSRYQPSKRIKMISFDFDSMIFNYTLIYKSMKKLAIDETCRNFNF